MYLQGLISLLIEASRLLFTHSFTHQKPVMSTYPEPGRALGAGINMDKTLLTRPSVLGT